MSLDYQTQAYIRTAIRGAVFTDDEGRGWRASLPAFSLVASGQNRNEAELNLAVLLTWHLAEARLTGAPLPIMSGVDLHAQEQQALGPGREGAVSEEERDPDQAWFWTSEWQSKEQEAEAALAEGRFQRFESGEDFLAALRDRRRENADL